MRILYDPGLLNGSSAVDHFKMGYFTCDPRDLGQVSVTKCNALYFDYLASSSHFFSLPTQWLIYTLPPTLLVTTTTEIQITFTLYPLNIHLLALVAQMITMILLNPLQSLLINRNLNQNHKLLFLQNFTRMFLYLILLSSFFDASPLLSVSSSVLKITI